MKIVSVIFIIYHKHYWMINVKRPYEEATIGLLETKLNLRCAIIQVTLRVYSKKGLAILGRLVNKIQ